MSNVYKPESNVDKPRDEGVIVPPVEREKKEKEPFAQAYADKSKRILSAAFFTYLKNLFDSFSSKDRIEGRVIDHIQILEDLKAFKHHLQTIGDQDLGNHPQFAHQLSELWHNLLQDFNNIEILERKNLKNVSTYRSFIDSINQYPQNEHSLGYYLTERVGEQWLPLPYIEILEQLHKEFKISPKSCQLTTWHNQLDQIIESVKKRIRI